MVSNHAPSQTADELQIRNLVRFTYYDKITGRHSIPLVVSPGDV